MVITRVRDQLSTVLPVCNKVGGDTSNWLWSRDWDSTSLYFSVKQFSSQCLKPKLTPRCFIILIVFAVLIAFCFLNLSSLSSNQGISLGGMSVYSDSLVQHTMNNSHTRRGPFNFPPPLFGNDQRQWESQSYRKVLSRYSITFAFIIRDGAHLIPHLRRQITCLAMAAGWRSYNIVAVENDSSDGTQNLLRQWKEESQVEFDLQINTWGDAASKKSFPTLARARNGYLESDLTKKSDFLLVVDTDMCDVWDYGRFSQIFADFIAADDDKSFKWDVLTANGFCLIYCDRLSFADQLRTPAGSPDMEQLWAHLKLNPNGCAQNPNDYSNIDCEMGPGDHPVIRVESAFGGLGLYRVRALEGCVYDGATEMEHKPLHRCVRERNDGRVFIVSDLFLVWDGCGNAAPPPYQCAVEPRHPRMFETEWV
eukprot:Nk52_evm6s283 gene=Nk52_evmTU6s283